MGIEVWRKREPVGCYCYQLFHQKKLVGIAIAEARRQDAEEQSLVQAIIDALRFEAQGGLMKGLPDSSECLGAKFFVILGRSLAKSFPDMTGQTRLVTYAPYELLSDPNLKKTAWQTLKKAHDFSA